MTTNLTNTVTIKVTINEDAGDIKVWTQGQTYNVECSGEAKIGAVLAKLNVLAGDEAKQAALQSEWGRWYLFKSEALTYKGETLDLASTFASNKISSGTEIGVTKRMEIGQHMVCPCCPCCPCCCGSPPPPGSWMGQRDSVHASGAVFTKTKVVPTGSPPNHEEMKR